MLPDINLFHLTVPVALLLVGHCMAPTPSYRAHPFQRGGYHCSIYYILEAHFSIHAHLAWSQLSSPYPTSCIAVGWEVGWPPPPLQRAHPIPWQGGWGCFSFEGQYSILKSLISTCVLSYIGSREYWLFDRSQRVIKRRASYPCSSRTLVPLFSGSELLSSMDLYEMSPMMTMSHTQWDKACSLMEANWWWQHRWRRKSHLDLMVKTSWFALKDAIDDWCDITELESEKWGPALRNRLEGEASVFKRLLDREELRQPNGRGVEYFKRTLRPTLCERSQTVFLYRFMRCMKNNRGNGDLMKWMTRFQIDERRLEESWMDSCPELDLASPSYPSRGCSKKNCTSATKCTSGRKWLHM